ncbi:YesL family protein [Enterococcus timonensis]|uniref:YesL family protein n=1 Tax=Enterococcus timonensis TaxID=1852364 RepID=UPI0008D9591D|nr:YesL family protein [Enterococcus timonensis]
MNNLFSPDRGIYKAMAKLYQLLVLNFIFLLTCLPIVTIGTAISAAYATSFKLQTGSEEKIVRTYFKKFKENLFQGSLVWLLVIAFAALIFAGYQGLRSFFQTFPATFYIFAFVLGVLLLTLEFVFPMMAKFASSTPKIFINSLILALKHLPYSMLIFFMFGAIGVALPLFIPQLFVLWLFLGFGLMIYLSSIVFQKIFSQYVD